MINVGEKQCFLISLNPIFQPVISVRNLPTSIFDFIKNDAFKHLLKFDFSMSPFTSYKTVNIAQPNFNFNVLDLDSYLVNLVERNLPG